MGDRTGGRLGAIESPQRREQATTQRSLTDLPLTTGHWSTSTASTPDAGPLGALWKPRRRVRGYKTAARRAARRDGGDGSSNRTAERSRSAPIGRGEFTSTS